MTDFIFRRSYDTKLYFSSSYNPFIHFLSIDKLLLKSKYNFLQILCLFCAYVMYHMYRVVSSGHFTIPLSKVFCLLLLVGFHQRTKIVCKVLLLICVQKSWEFLYEVLHITNKFC